MSDETQNFNWITETDFHLTINTNLLPNQRHMSLRIDNIGIVARLKLLYNLILKGNLLIEGELVREGYSP